MNRNLVGSIYGRSSIKIAHFVTIRYQTWLPQTIPVSDWLISRKPLGQMNQHLVGSILGRSSIVIVHLVPIRYQTWPPQAILISDWLISKKSCHLKPLGERNRKLVGRIPGSSFINIPNVVPIRKQTWSPKAILVSDWLISKKTFSLKPLCQMNRNLVGSIFGR
jgi:hypothetical protein